MERNPLYIFVQKLYFQTVKSDIKKYELLIDGGVEFIDGIDDAARWREVLGKN